MKAPIVVCFMLLASVAVQSVRAQFSPAFLQNGSYWDDGKAEVDFYDAQVMRDGQLRHCEMQMVLLRTSFAPEQNNKDSSGTPPPVLAAIRMSQLITIPLGLVNEQRSSVIFCDLNNRFVREEFAVAAAEGITSGQTTIPTDVSTIWLELNSPGSPARHVNIDSSESLRILKDELPLRLRLLDFSKASGSFNVRVIDLQHAGTSAQGSALDQKLTFQAKERTIEVQVGNDKASDRFVLDRDFPFLLREWKTADGSTFRLKNSLKTDYRQFMKEGDREKALKDPMLRHPD